MPGTNNQKLFVEVVGRIIYPTNDDSESVMWILTHAYKFWNKNL